jgi:hypothetical protein
VSEHTVTIEFDRVGYTPTLTFKCHAPEDADCRNACPRSECEEGCVEPGKHETTPLDYCNVVAWLENTDDVETCIVGGSTEITAPIEIEWGGTYDGPDWRFRP